MDAKKLDLTIILCIFVDIIDIIIMRILYVTDALAVWGGIERVLSDKANALVRDYGCEVFVVTTDQGNHPIPFPFDERIKIIDLNIRFHQQYQYHGFTRLKKYLEIKHQCQERMKACIDEVNPDVISCFRDGLVNAILDVKGNIPLIFESHAMWLDIKYEKTTFLHKITLDFQRKKFRKLDKLVTLTKGDADDWSRVCKNVCVIPNIVHLNESGHYSSCEEKSVIFAGRFNLQKDQASLIKVWSIVQKSHPDWTLNVYGNGELKSYYESEVSKLKLNIRIYPAVSDIFDKFMESSMLVMTSLFEPFGLVLVEAMSCGIPVIAFDCPYGPADIISDGKDGFLIEDRDIKTFADRICQLIENPELRIKIGKAAIQSAQRYRAEVIMPQWINLFSQLQTK